MHIIIRKWIVEILNSHSDLMHLALSQRAKFEGWLKFELATKAVNAGANAVILEAPISQASKMRCDLLIDINGAKTPVELKTPNANWRIGGVMKRTRPITANIEAIIADAQKLKQSHTGGVVAFVLFPIPANKDSWRAHVQRIGTALKINDLTAPGYCSLMNFPIADAVVCSFTV